MIEWILDFVAFFNGKFAKVGEVSLRDVLAWVKFITESTTKKSNHNTSVPLTLFERYVHGACLVVIDGLGITHASRSSHILRECFEFLYAQSPSNVDKESLSNLLFYPERLQVALTSTSLRVGPFSIPSRPSSSLSTTSSSSPSSSSTTINIGSYSFNAPTTVKNLFRLSRGMQLRKAILLEGSPGVGKTSLGSVFLFFR